MQIHHLIIIWKKANALLKKCPVAAVMVQGKKIKKLCLIEKATGFLFFNSCNFSELMFVA